MGLGEYVKGDIGNFTADANGNGTITLTTDEWVHQFWRSQRHS
jgi:Cu-Zn family superoxide dismutase